MRTRIFLAMVLAMTSSLATAGVWRVEQDGSGDFVTIQPAVDAAASGDTILIGPGYYTEQASYPEIDEWTACVFWDDDRDLTFIGVDSDLVTIGVDVYEPSGRKAGISANGSGILRVQGIGFARLQDAIGVVNGEVYVIDCSFEVCYWGVGVQNTVRCEAAECEFQDMDAYSVTSYGSQHAEVASCTLNNARVNFNSTRNGIIRNCTVIGGNLAYYYLSMGMIEGCTAQCGDNNPCISISDSDSVRVYGNVIVGGRTNMTAIGRDTRVFMEQNDFSSPSNRNFDFGSNASVFAHNNHIRRGSPFQEYIVVTSGYSHSYERTVDMGSNFWFDDSTPLWLDELIWDGNDDMSLNIFVNYEPIRTEPVAAEKSSLGGVKALFR